MPAAELSAVGLVKSSISYGLHRANLNASRKVCSQRNDGLPFSGHCLQMAKREARWDNSIRYWRKRKGMSLEQLGAALPNGSASKGTISAIESGKSKPSLERLYDIAEALEVSMAALLSSPPEAEVIEIWSRIPTDSQDLAKGILSEFAKSA